MLKLTSLALGLLTIIAIAPASQAATTSNPLSIHKPAGDLHSQVIIKLGGQQQYDYHRGEAERRRELERERERELEREREAAQRRHQSYGHRQSHGDNRGDYHRDH
jgi:hypothetical protein